MICAATPLPNRCTPFYWASFELDRQQSAEMEAGRDVLREALQAFFSPNQQLHCISWVVCLSDPSSGIRRRCSFQHGVICLLPHQSADTAFLPVSQNYGGGRETQCQREGKGHAQEKPPSSVTSPVSNWGHSA